MNYIIITPARDEEKTIETTIKSVISQSILPAKWLIIDDNSTDNTPKIIEKYSLDYSFIKTLSICDQRKRIPGKGAMSIFNYGIKTIELNKYDFIVKLDGDMEFANNYFEEIFKQFNQNPKLGIASGLIIEKESLKPSKKHFFELTQGNTKVYKKECFEKIYPLDEIKGWDFIDNIKAKYFRFETRILKHLTAIHLKPLDAKVGYKKENYLKGYYDAFFKYPLVFLFVKGIKKVILEKPFFLNGFYYVKGFLKNRIIEKNFYENKSIIKYLHNYQIERLKTFIYNYKKYY